MIKINWKQFFLDYVIFGFWQCPHAIDDDGRLLFKWRWQARPNRGEPWHSCYKIGNGVVIND